MTIPTSRTVHPQFGTPALLNLSGTKRNIIVIGSSAGGVPALQWLFAARRLACPPQSAWCPRQPVIMFTGGGMAKMDQRVHALGANGIIEKELPLQRLMGSLRRLLKAPLPATTTQLRKKKDGQWQAVT